MSENITVHPRARELDMLLTAGERISVALLSMALSKLKLEAVSYTGSQVGIITDNQHTDARILEIKGDRVKRALAEHKIPVVCGFQGVSEEKEITTLGRGGSDTTALALSAALGARECIIYTDVDGVFTEDPRYFPGVKKIAHISYDEMLELSSRGAQVLHPRASSIAARFSVPVVIRNSFTAASGTRITSIDEMERPKPKAVTHSDDLYLVTLVQVMKRPHSLSQIITELSHRGIHLRFFFHGVSSAKRFDLSFITPLNEKDRIRSLLKTMNRKLGARRIEESTDISSITLVGRGIGSDNRILAEVLLAISKNRAHIEAMTMSEVSINMFLQRKYRDRAIKGLLDKFHLRK
jgi:aspartate kinase